MEKLLLNFATSESLTFDLHEGDSGMYGLSWKATSSMCGCVSPDAKTEQEFVTEVLNYADIFVDMAESVLAAPSNDEDEEARLSKHHDHITLKNLIKKYNDHGFDRNKLESLTRTDWKERLDMRSLAPRL